MQDFTINTPWGEKSIRVFCGNVTALEQADLLVCSAFRGDYMPTPTSLIGALYRERCISVADLAKAPALNLKDLGVWISAPLIGQPFGRIARTLHEMGCQFDYVSDRQLKRLRFGACPYRTILVPSVRAMPLATAQALVRLAKEGFEVVFAGGFPETVPGFFEYEKQTEQLRSLFADPPKRMVRCGRDDLLKRLRVEPFTHAAGLSAWRRRSGDTTYYFIVNERPSAVEEAVRLASPAKAIWEMDLMTGRVRGARRADGRAHLSLGPYGSVILAASAKPDERRSRSEVPGR